MANLYESKNFNIVSVYIDSNQLFDEVDQVNYTQEFFLLKVQRLPVSLFPETTEVSIYSNDIPLDASQEDFLASAPSIVATRLAEFDAEFTGEQASPKDTANLAKKYT